MGGIKRACVAVSLLWFMVKQSRVVTNQDWFVTKQSFLVTSLVEVALTPVKSFPSRRKRKLLCMQTSPGPELRKSIASSSRRELNCDHFKATE